MVGHRVGPALSLQLLAIWNIDVALRGGCIEQRIPSSEILFHSSRLSCISMLTRVRTRSWPNTTTEPCAYTTKYMDIYNLCTDVLRPFGIQDAQSSICIRHRKY